MTTYRLDSSACYNDEEREQILSIIGNYNTALTLLDNYNHKCMKRPKGHNVLTYEKCRNIIDMMRFKTESELFGNEKDDSFKGSIGNIYLTYNEEDVYLTLEEKAANLLYFITENHSFSDGNKHIAAIFIYFLYKNGALYDGNGNKKLSNFTLATLTIMIAESRVEEKEIMVTIIMNCI